MMTAKHPAIMCSVLLTILFFIWITLFKNEEWFRVLGSIVFPMIAAAFSMYWIISAYRKVAGEKRYYWLLLFLGTFTYFFSNLIWLFFYITQGMTNYSTVSYLLWMVAYSFYLGGIIYKIRLISREEHNESYIFNIVIFITTATAFTIHYLIEPILSVTEHSYILTFITLSYPVIDLTVLFCVTCLYFLVSDRNEKMPMYIVALGFTLQVVADSIYAYTSLDGGYTVGSFVDIIWLMALLLIGISSLFVKDNLSNSDIQPNEFIEKESIFPYISMILLTFLVFNSYDWNLNALSLGLTLCFALVLIRLQMTMRKNRDLMYQYRFLAYRDPLTGLKNRESFSEELEKLMRISKQQKTVTAVLLMDLDRFKNINDTLGHQVGDRLLRLSAQRISKVMNQMGHAYRIGGDEFVLILPNTNESRSIEIAEGLLLEFNKPFILNNYEVMITPSIGISIFPTHGYDSETLLKNADSAMYLAKEKGRNNFQFYSVELNENLSRKLLIENELRKAIEKKQFEIVYQPIISLKSGEVNAMEALLRWNHPQLGLVSPTEFIPIAEETGQIITIGEWVIKSVCVQNKLWQEKGIPPICVAVNVSVRQLNHLHFLNSVKQILEETNLQPELLEVEITESIMQNISESIKVLNQLRNLGVKTAIDDFGTGYSSLYLLKELPIDTLKIDKSFIDDVSNHKNLAMIKTVIDIALNLNLNIVAEGIETEDQLNILKTFNCSNGQGYLLSKPIEADLVPEIIKILMKGHVTSTIPTSTN